MKRNLLMALLAIFLAAVTACQKQGESPECSFWEKEASHQGQTMHLVVKTKGAWVLGSLPDWITTNKMKGFGNKTLELTFSENVSFEQRSAMLVVTDTSTGQSTLVECIQQPKDPADYYLTIKPSVNSNEGILKLRIKDGASLAYRKNGGEWTPLTREGDENYASLRVEGGDTIELKGTSTESIATESFPFLADEGMDKGYEIYGNILSLYYSDSFRDKDSYPSEHVNGSFAFTGCKGLESARYLALPKGKHNANMSMFRKCASLTKAPALKAENLEKNAYKYMFRECESLKEAPSLPSTSISESCYKFMFAGCTSLEKAPSLPARNIADSCYYGMFKDCASLTEPAQLPAPVLKQACYVYLYAGCTSLKKAPALDAMTLATSCYADMFKDCTSLEEAPELPATTLNTKCYHVMFQACTALKKAPALPALTLADSCYYGMFYKCSSLKEAPDLPAKELRNGCYTAMFNSCTALEQAPELPARKLKPRCYEYMFQYCPSLKVAPDLPAENLVDKCYGYMYYGCTSLEQISANFTTDITKTSGDWYEYTKYWTRGIEGNGRFIRNKDATWENRGDCGVPENWEKTTYEN